MGAVPDWYGPVRAARYLGVPVWELLEPTHTPWIDVALAAQSAENAAAADHLKRAAPKRR